MTFEIQVMPLINGMPLANDREEFFFLPNQSESFPILDYLSQGNPPCLPIFSVSLNPYRDQIIFNDNWKVSRPHLLGYDHIHKYPVQTTGLYWVAGIYGIYNRDKEKIWIGSSAQIRKRWVNHRCGSQYIAREKRNELQQDLLTNPTNFIFCVIEVLETYDSSTRADWWNYPCPHSKEHLRQREQFWLDLVPQEHKYNRIRAVGRKRKRSSS